MSDPPALSWKVWALAAACGLLFAIGEMLSGAISGMLHLPPLPMIPGVTDMAHAARNLFLASLLLGAGLAPLARGITGPRRARGLVFFALLFVCVGVNTGIELTIFTTTYGATGAMHYAFNNLLPAFLCASALAYFLPAESGDRSFAAAVRSFFAARRRAAWVWRFALAILAFPLAYLIFGLMVAPFVIATYRAGLAGFTIPPLAVILRTQILRSSLFLLASLPAIILWRRSRGELIFALGMAHWVLVGLFGLTQAFFLPTVLRVGHSLEIGADSFVYALALVFLLVPAGSPASTTSSASRPVLQTN